MDKHEFAIEILNNNDIKPSFVRVRVLQYILENQTHPTVDEIYSALSPKLPTLSKTTVYNAINLFAEKKIINSIKIDNNEIRYDYCTHPHGHFKCIHCNNVYDFEIDLDTIKFSGLDNFITIDKELYFKGSCENCLKNK